MKYRIVRDRFSGREVQYWNGVVWKQCSSGGHVQPSVRYNVNTFNSHMSAAIFMAIHEMRCQRKIICEQLDEVVRDYKHTVDMK